MCDSRFLSFGFLKWARRACDIFNLHSGVKVRPLLGPMRVMQFLLLILMISCQEHFVKSIYAAPDVTMAFSTASSGSTITASEHNTVRNETSSKFNSHSHVDISQTAATLNIGSSSGGTSISSAGALVLEGATSDGFELTVQPTDPTVDATLAINANNLTATRTVLIPNANSITLPTGAVFMMITGACPAGSSNITATYSDRFPRINATPASTGGVDTHTHAVGSYAGPSHTHNIPATSAIWGGEDVETTALATAIGGAEQQAFRATIDNPTGSGGTGAITGTSASGDNVPAYFTVILCQVS